MKIAPPVDGRLKAIRTDCSLLYPRAYLEYLYVQYFLPPLSLLVSSSSLGTEPICYTATRLLGLRSVRPSNPDTSQESSTLDKFMRAAYQEAKKGRDEGGIPIGSVIVIDGRIVGRGHNRRVQRGSAILHAEMDCLENAGRLTASDYARATLYSTLSPCDMCSGTVLLYKIPKVVIGENQTFQGPEEYVRSRGVELVIQQNQECITLMREFIADHPELWNEDIGV